jgi:hypothetical protein
MEGPSPCPLPSLGRGKRGENKGAVGAKHPRTLIFTHSSLRRVPEGQKFAANSNFEKTLTGIKSLFEN